MGIEIIVSVSIICSVITKHTDFYHIFRVEHGNTLLKLVSKTTKL